MWPATGAAIESDSPVTNNQAGESASHFVPTNALYPMDFVPTDDTMGLEMRVP